MYTSVDSQGKELEIKNVKIKQKKKKNPVISTDESIHPLGYYSKLDSKGNNPNGFVEKFQLPQVIKSQSITDPSYKKMMEDYELKKAEIAELKIILQ